MARIHTDKGAWAEHLKAVLSARASDEAAQIGDPGCDPDLGAGRDCDHASRSSNTTRNECGATAPSMRSRPRGNWSWIVPAGNEDGGDAGPGPAGESVIVMGSSPAAGAGRMPFRADGAPPAAGPCGRTLPGNHYGTARLRVSPFRVAALLTDAIIGPMSSLLADFLEPRQRPASEHRNREESTDGLWAAAVWSYHVANGTGRQTVR